MDPYNCLYSKPIYNYTIENRSLISLNNYYNVCFISSFYNGLKKIYPTFPHILDLIINIYPQNKNNLYTNFANDFVILWKKIKTFMEAYNFDNKNIVLSIWIPLKNKQCVNLVNLDLDKYDKDVIDAFMDEEYSELQNKKIINIIQYNHHFDSIIVLDKSDQGFNIDNMEIDKEFLKN